jgi:tetratricopeptide (TPR) repeat protein
MNVCMAVVLLLFSHSRLLIAGVQAAGTSPAGTSVPVASVPASGAPASNDRQANALLQQGRVEEASAMLQSALAAQPTDAVAHQLLCRVFYAQEMADQAIHECESATANAPGDSNTHMWLGRAYGLKASHASPFLALGLARKVHLAFERAVELDATNVYAMSDLGEYYVAAPAIIGGGLDKAQTLAATMQPQYPSQSHRLLALIAEKKKDVATAEAEFRSAAAVGHTPEAYIDLGDFYRRQNQPDQLLAALQAGIDADRRRDAALVDAASTLSAAHLSPQLAESLLREYLSSPAKSDAAPAFKVHLQLGNLLAKRGDSTGAQREYAAALALAPNYAPARKAVTGS